MRIKIKMKRPTFMALFKISVGCVLGYMLICLGICGMAAIFGAFHIDPALREKGIIHAILSLIAMPLIFGLIFALPGWIFWMLYSLFRKSTVVLYVDSMKDIEETQGAVRNGDIVQQKEEPCALK